MNLLEIIKAFQYGLARVGLWVLATLAVGCVIVWLCRSGRRAAVWWRSLRAWLDKIVFIGLFMACILIGGTKLNNPPLPQMPLPQSVVQMVTDDEIAQGYRLESVATNDAILYAMLDGVSPSFNWHKRGTFGEWSRLDLGGFSFPLGTNDEAVTAFSVFNDGRIRPRPRDDKREICAVGVPMLAMQGASRFWVADGVGGSKLLTWENFFLNADTNAPVNAQIELFSNGDFITRSNNVERIYLRVYPFDYDGDGLENSVDPNPLVAGADAHGTNAEWYNTVCSNVLDAVATSCDPSGSGAGGTQLVASVELSWREGVNSNAYYFVDVVAANGPVPIYFTGDRDSRLGNPVIVALGGATNRVPLLIGVDYAITSPVPFTVSYPMEYMYPILETNQLCRAHIRWPLEFTIEPDGFGGYVVGTSPYDPGCTFQWGSDGSGGGLRSMPMGGASCAYSTSGNWVSFNCGGNGDCGCHGCSVSGCAVLEYASFEIPSIWCGCWYHDPDDPGNGSVVTNVPSVSVSFDKAVLFYEDTYTNAPNDVVAKRSTNTTLTVFACGGETGGMLYVSEQNIRKLVRVDGDTITFPYAAFIPPRGGMSFSIEYGAEMYSDSQGDITVMASLAPVNGGETLSDSASTTAVKLEFTPDYLIGDCIHRHRLGVRERAKCSWLPTTVAVTYEAGTGGRTNLIDGDWHYVAPLTTGASPYLTAVCQGARYPFTLDIVEPQTVVAKSASPFDYDVPPNVAGGAGMELELVVLPTNVSFMGIAVQEVPSDYKDPQGYFANSYFDIAWSHTTNRGAGVWHSIQAENLFMYDYAEMGDRLPRMTPAGEVTDDYTYGWITGTMNWKIPVGWNENGVDETEPPVKQICIYWQRFRMASNGTLEVEKLSNVVQRATNTIIRLNGEIVPLRPR